MSKTKKSSLLYVMDFSEFWSPKGGGVRRYYLEKINFYKKNKTKVDYTFIMPSDHDEVEKINSQLRIIKVKSLPLSHKGGYRSFLRLFKTIRLLQNYKPQILEIGSPYIAPWLFRIASFFVQKKPTVVGFWHANFPETYVKRYLIKYPKLSRFCEQITWLYAKITYNSMSRIFVSSKIVQKKLVMNSLKNSCFLPLGVDTQTFSPLKNLTIKNKQKTKLLNSIKSNVSQPKLSLAELKKRKIIFFPHRLSREKGLPLLLKAYEHIYKQQKNTPLLIFSGVGPLLETVIQATNFYNTVFHLDYIDHAQKMASWYQISDLTVALSAWETFGLSIVEAMACGIPVIGVNQGAALEHLKNSKAGVIVPQNNSTRLAQAIQQILSLRSRKAYTQKARSYAENLSWKTCFTQQINEYQKVVNL